MDTNQKLIDTCQAAAEALVEAQGEWAGVDETYAPEWTHPLKAAAAEARAAIAEAATLLRPESTEVKTWKLVVARTEQEEFQGTDRDAARRFDCQIEVVPDETCILFWLRGSSIDWVEMRRWTPGLE